MFKFFAKFEEHVILVSLLPHELIQITLKRFSFATMHHFDIRSVFIPIRFDILGMNLSFRIDEM